jgi:glycosyltransferase involved in cell wall biosynthesis
MNDSRRKITVLRVIDRLNVGGPAIHVALASKGLDRSRFRTVLVHGNVEPGEADMSDLITPDVERVVVPSLGRELRPIADLKTAIRVAEVIRKVRPDVIHTHKAKAGAIGRFAAAISRVPVRIHTFHGHVFRGYFNPIKTRAFIEIERALAISSTKLIALSQGLVNELVDEYRIAPRNRFVIVPLGLDLEPFANASRADATLRRELAIDQTTPLIGIVGRMVPIKDHATFLRAAALLAAEDPRRRFVLIGGGELENDLRDLARSLRLEDRVHFLGWRRDLVRLYPDLDVVALSSKNEGTPVTLIEAMATGVPVAATAVGGVGDLLAGNRGELAPPTDPSALAAAIARALRPDVRARAIEVRAEIAARFGAKRLCRDLETLYESLLTNPRSTAMIRARSSSTSRL